MSPNITPIVPPNMPQDELLQRYAQAKAQLPDGMPDAPSNAVRQRILNAARKKADAMNKVALHADNTPTTEQKGLKNTSSQTAPAKEAANDSFWNIRALGSLAVMGLAGLLYWQFEHGTPEEQAAAKSAKPSATVVAAAPAAAPQTAPTVATAQAPAAAPAAQAKAEAATALPVKPPASIAGTKDAASGIANGVATQETAIERASSKAASAKMVTREKASSAPALPSTAEIAAASNELPTAASVPPAAVAPAAAPTPRAAAPATQAAAQSAQLEKSTADAALAKSAPATEQRLVIPPAPAPAYVAPTPAAPRVLSAPSPSAARSAIASPDKLFQAIETKSAALLREALAQGASQNARTQEGSPALHQTVIQRWPEGVRILLAAGADRSSKNSKGHTAADVALELGYADITDLLATNR